MNTARAYRYLAAGMGLAILLIPWRGAFALDPSLDVSQYAHTAWRVREGFGKGPIHSIAQTPDGYLWLGTDFGLLRFDGVRTVAWQVPADEHLASNSVAKLLVSRDGTLWIGSDKGLASWKDGKLVHYPELAGHTVRALLEDHGGTVWAGGFVSLGRRGRLCAIQSGRVHCSDLEHGVMGLYEDNRKTLWVSMFEGLWRWTPPRPDFFPLGPNMRSAIVAADEGGLLVSTAHGIQRLTEDKVQVYSLGIPVPQSGVNSFLRDHDGGLWIGTAEGLMHVHQGRSDVFRQSDGLSGNLVRALFEDREGSIWVATEEGLDRLRDFAIPTFSANEGIPTAIFGHILAATDGSFWFGTPDGLINWTSARETPRSVLRGLVKALFQDSRGRLWVILTGAFGYIDNDEFVPIKTIPDESTGSIAEGAPGDLWVDFDDAICHLVNGRIVEEISAATLGRKDRLRGKLAVDPVPGGVWIGFDPGGVSYLRQGRFERSYTSADGLGEGQIFHVRLDRRGALWASTEGGLSRIKEGHVATLSSRNGIPCDGVHWSAEDMNHSVWLYLQCGMVRISESEMSAWVEDPKRAIRVTLFDGSDGAGTKKSVIGNPPVTESLDGKLWFSVPEGMSVVDPRHLPFNRHPPTVRIEQVIADGKTYWQSLYGDASSGTPKLPALARDLTINYTALSLVAPEKVHFRYKLEGQDPEWREVLNQREVQYSNLRPGKYTFRVTASNNSGVWNEKGAALDFSIAPAYWQTNWFRAACVAALLLLLWALYQLRLHQVRRAFNARLEERVGERTRIARDLHDTLLQSFQGLLLRFQTVYELFPRRPADAQKMLGSAIDQTAQAITAGREAVQGLRASTVERNDLALAITTLGEDLAIEASSHATVGLQVDVEGTPRTLHPIVRDEIYRIASEALRNAFRHAEPKQIEVELRYDERQFRLRVRDDGKGIDPSFLAAEGRAGHYGLDGMRERARLVGGNLTVWTAPASGTEIELSVPATHAYGASTVPRRPWFADRF